MIRKIVLPFIIFLLSAGTVKSQAVVTTADIFSRQDPRGGELNIYQDRALDTLISRYIIASKQKITLEGTQGMEGFRIQIYYNSTRNAREESARVRADFINMFPDIKSYAEYREPGYFMVRVGDYRSRTEGFKDMINIKKEFPDAYFVPSIINFPDKETY